MNKLNVRSKSKKIISLATLASVCCTIPFMYSQTNANAGILGRIFSGVRATSSSLLGSRVSSQGNIVNNSRRLSASSRGSLVSSNNGGQDNRPVVRTGGVSGSANSLASRVEALETQQKIEAGRADHPFNKAVVASGLVASAAMVAGVVGGIIQQSKFTQFTKDQTEKDQKVQEDINAMKQVFQKKEFPEAEQYIIDYYKKNYGIDITS